jgi:hypothetical protein
MREMAPAAHFRFHIPCSRLPTAQDSRFDVNSKLYFLLARFTQFFAAWRLGARILKIGVAFKAVCGAKNEVI